MFDALIFCSQAEPTAQTLATLVEGAVAGSIGRLTLIADDENAAIAALAEEAGCGLAAGIQPRALAAAIAERVTTSHALVMEAGVLLPPGWPTALTAEIRRAGGLSEDMALVFRPARTADWLRALLAVSVKGRATLRHGALIPRPRLINPRYRGGGVKSFGPIHMTNMRVGRVMPHAP